MVIVRADANNVIGMGHIMRCMSIGKQLHKLGEKVLFVISENYSENIIRTSGFECVCIGNMYSDKESEIDELSEIIIDNAADILLIDSYEVTEKYFFEIGKIIKTIYIDDVNSFKYDVDVVINYILGIKIEEYIKWGYDMEKTDFWLGSSYIPLREEFETAEYEVKSNVESVLITTGGTDEFNVILDIVNKMDEMNLQHLKKNIVVGRFYRYINELTEYAKKDKNIAIYSNISNMSEIMKESDIAISAGGTTLSELCAIGVPTVCFVIADNQIDVVDSYSEDKLMIYCGDIRRDRESVIDNIIKQVTALTDDFLLRKKMFNGMKNIVDGKGAYRVAEKIVELIK